MKLKLFGLKLIGLVGGGMLVAVSCGFGLSETANGQQKVVNPYLPARGFVCEVKVSGR